MRADLIAVGTEMLRFGRRDTNGDWLADRLGELGIEIAGRATVGDDLQGIAEQLSVSLARAGTVLMTGGLGATEDDRTRQAVSLALGRPLERDPDLARALQDRFLAAARPWSGSQARQADRPAGAAWIDNRLGSAPGLWCEQGTRLVIALPGVPAEMRAMFTAEVEPRLRGHGTPGAARRVLRIAGLSESAVERRVIDLYGALGVEVTILAGGAGVELLLAARDARGAEGGSARSCVDRVAESMRARLGAHVYAQDGETLAEVVGAALRREGKTLATAESCTAGLVSAAITDVPGASAWFRGGLVAYDDSVKMSLAGVQAGTLAVHGAVSEPTARELARAARERCGSDYGLGVTGIAGPGGGSPDKPVGLVYVAVDDAQGAVAQRLLLSGDRALIRARTVSAILDLLRRRLDGIE